MARPRKQTVDYFPHVAKGGKTMFIIESLFGNDGYAFWFKILELLATTEGHVINCRNSSEWEFLLAKTKLNDIMARSILDKLSDLGSIDQELWENGFIWSQNFVDNIADVYKNRKAVAPKKPLISSFYEQKPTSSIVSTNRNTPKQEFSVQPTDENPQSKVKETKVKERKVNNTEIKKEFFEMWQMMPVKTDVKISFEYFMQAVREGTTIDEVRTGIENYNKFIDSQENFNPKFIKTDKNFFRDRYWINHQTAPKKFGKQKKVEPLPKWVNEQDKPKTVQTTNDDIDADQLREQMISMGIVKEDE